MTDLAAQILAALDRAEETARAATPGPWVPGAGWHGDRVYSVADAKPPEGVAEAPSHDDAAHIAANDPAHVLRLTAALREVVKLHAYDADFEGCGHCRHDQWPCPTLRALASVWDVAGDNT